MTVAGCRAVRAGTKPARTARWIALVRMTPMHRRLPLFAVVLAGLALASHRAHAQGMHADMLLFSTVARGGALTLAYDFAEPIELFENVCVAGRCLYSNTNPGFNVATSDRPAEGLYLLRDRTQVSIEIVGLDTGASVKVGSAVLNAVGAQAVIGTTPAVHVHPSWQVAVPPTQRGEFTVRFRLTTSSRFYEPSQVFTVVMRNGTAEATATPTSIPSVTATATASATALPSVTETALPTAAPSATATPSPVPTATATPPAAAGADANCDGGITAADVVAVVAAVGTPATACGVDPIPDGVINDLDVAGVVTNLFSAAQ